MPSGAGSGTTRGRLRAARLNGAVAGAAGSPRRGRVMSEPASSRAPGMRCGRTRRISANARAPNWPGSGRPGGRSPAGMGVRSAGVIVTPYLRIIAIGGGLPSGPQWGPAAGHQSELSRGEGHGSTAIAQVGAVAATPDMLLSIYRYRKSSHCREDRKRLPTQTNVWLDALMRWHPLHCHRLAIEHQPIKSIVRRGVSATTTISGRIRVVEYLIPFRRGRAILMPSNPSRRGRLVWGTWRRCRNTEERSGHRCGLTPLHFAAAAPQRRLVDVPRRTGGTDLIAPPWLCAQSSPALTRAGMPPNRSMPGEPRRIRRCSRHSCGVASVCRGVVCRVRVCSYAS
jgi:hypothetical protein